MASAAGDGFAAALGDQRLALLYRADGHIGGEAGVRIAQHFGGFAH